MKNFFVVTLFSLFAFAHAQVDLKQVKESFNAKDYSQTIHLIQTEINNVQPHALDPSDAVELYYLLGQSYMKNNNLQKAADAFAHVTALESDPYFWIKNKESKEKLYFKSEEEAKNAASQGEFSSPKSVTLEKKYSNEIMLELNTKLPDISKLANDQYNAKNFNSAGQNFETVYNIQKALGMPNEEFLYYAAISYYQSEDYQAALPLFQQIIKDQYEGLDPENNTLESAYKLSSVIYYNDKQYNKAIEVCKEGLKKFPKSKELNDYMISAYDKSGDTKGFIQQLENNVKNDPTNASNYYNLGVLYSKEDNGFEKSKSNFLKSIELDATNETAYSNVTYLIVQQNNAINDQIKNLGSSKEDANKEDQLNAQRKELFQNNVSFLLTAHQTFPNQKLFVQALKLAYAAMDDNTNYKKYDTLEKSMP